MDNRPQGREKHITGAGKPIQKHGSGLGTGPVGQSGGYAGRTGSQPSGGQRSTGTRSSGGGLLKIIIAAVILLGGGGIGLGSIFGGGESGSFTVPGNQQYYQEEQHYTQPSQSGSVLDLSSILSGSVGNVSNGWAKTSNVGRLDSSVVPSARAKRTNILGGNRDTVTIMVYMCGTDLESKSGMATSDLKEMMAANIDSNVNLIVYTGGCTQWRNNVVSSRVNQIYKVTSGDIQCIVSDDGSAAMTKPSTLAGFIKYCAKNYPANRNELIFWDHGGGSLSGYGYDEKNPNSGSMTLKGIDEALSSANVTFDFIGFDACLMATLENALMLTPYADYLIASEETEPGVGWYYTDWLTALSNNRSMATLELGKKIADDFVRVCNSSCAGQKTTLSVVDLAELESTVPAAFRDFASDTVSMLENNEYKTVSDARSGAREFAASSKIDQIDLVHLAYNMGTDDGEKLADAILGAVKYNNTSSNMTNAYGMSIYFPYQKASKVGSAVQTYDALGIDGEYAKCIQQFASLEMSGQTVSGGSSVSPLSSLLGSVGGGSSYGGSMSTDMISSLLSGLMGSSSFTGKSLDIESTAKYISENSFDGSKLAWENVGGRYQIALTEDQWSLVSDIVLNVFFDDGEGYIDLGTDNVFEFTDEGALLGEYDGTWLAINDQPVAYYYIDTVYDGNDYTITGRVPVLLNGSRAELIIVFDSANPYGYIAGARSDYRDGETETIAKGMTGLNDGDEIVFLCDYYSYGGEYRDSYVLGEAWTYSEGEEVTISNVYIDGDAASAMYMFTDMYCQTYWTEIIP